MSKASKDYWILASDYWILDSGFFSRRYQMSYELIIAGMAFLVQVVAWAALPMKSPRRTESEE